MEDHDGPARKRGIAMLVAIMIMSMMMLFTADLIVNSQVNLQLAVANRDNLKAEYMAQSAVNVAIILLSADFAYDLQQAEFNKQNASLSDGPGDFWSMMNGIPIGGETVEMLSMFSEGFGLSRVNDSGVLDGLKLFDGSWTLDVEDESKKINVNACVHQRCTEMELMLEALFSCPAEKAFLDLKRIEPKELIANIKDWSDKGGRVSTGSAYSSEDDPYQEREPRQKAKNGPIESLEELKQIEGWDDEIHEVFSPFLTLWPFPKTSGGTKALLNINTADRALLWCLFPEAKGECAQKSTMSLLQSRNDKTNLSGDGKKIGDILKETLCYTGGTTGSGEAANRESWFQQYSMVFKVKAKGTVGDQERDLTAVIQRVMPDLSGKEKQKTSYKILYWRMI